MIKYIFWAKSVPGLEKDIELYAKNYREAKNKVYKYIVTGHIDQHLHKEKEDEICWFESKKSLEE